jgi:hypothetical protein
VETGCEPKVLWLETRGGAISVAQYNLLFRWFVGMEMIFYSVRSERMLIQGPNVHSEP